MVAWLSRDSWTRPRDKKTVMWQDTLQRTNQLDLSIWSICKFCFVTRVVTQIIFWLVDSSLCDGVWKYRALIGYCGSHGANFPFLLAVCQTNTLATSPRTGPAYMFWLDLIDLIARVFMSCQILQSSGSGRYRGSQIGSHSLMLSVIYCSGLF